MSKRNARITNAVTWIMTITCTVTCTLLTYFYGWKSMKNYFAATIMLFGIVMVLVHILLIKQILEKSDIGADDATSKARQERSWENKVILTCTLFVVNYVVCTWPGCIERIVTGEISVSFVVTILFLLNSLIDPCLYFFKDYLRRNHKRGSHIKNNSHDQQ